MRITDHMGAFILSILTAAFVAWIGYFFTARKHKKEKVWELRNEFYTNVNKRLSSIEVILDKNRYSGGVFGLNDYDGIDIEISSIEEALACEEIFISSEAIEVISQLLKSLKEGMYWYREFLHEHGPDDPLEFMKSATAKAKDALMNSGRRGLGV